MTETEIKLRWNKSAGEAAALVEGKGYRALGPRHLEVDQLFDRSSGDAPGELQSARKILRLRRSQSTADNTSKATVTYKGSPQEGRYKIREEIEFDASSGEAVELVLARLGYRATFRYEKYRRKFKRETEPGLITLDETPIGVFMELEGPVAWIDSTAANLDFAPADYVTDSYAALYRQYCLAHSKAPGNMIFSEITEKSGS
jgi:adenylate cyclase class 2